MLEFNENPFLKDTQVSCFSNGMEAEFWQNKNCDSCRYHENESTIEENAKCKLSYNIALGWITGTIPLWAAKEIGCTYDPLYLQAKLWDGCRRHSPTDSALEDLPF
jgi:hypothetical protein